MFPKYIYLPYYLSTLNIINNKSRLIIVIFQTRNLPPSTLHWEQNWNYNLECGDATSPLRTHFPSLQGSQIWRRRQRLICQFKAPCQGSTPGVACAALGGLRPPAQEPLCLTLLPELTAWIHLPSLPFVTTVLKATLIRADKQQGHIMGLSSNNPKRAKPHGPGAALGGWSLLLWAGGGCGSASTKHRAAGSCC